MTGRAGPRSQARPPSAAHTAGLQGHYAGAASRLAAYVVDLGASSGAFTLSLAGISFVVNVVSGVTVTWSSTDLVVGVAYVAWLFIYFAYSWSASGRTLGMALLGLRVVRGDGAAAEPRRAVVRTLALPLSFLLFGAGFAGILIGKRRRALHDVIAGTVVVYSWDARAARLRFLAREGRAGP